VPNRVTHEDLMRFLDGELPPEEHALVQAAIASSTELAREAAIYRAMKGRFQEISFHPGTYHASVWDGVNQHLTRPIGWILVLAGAAVWAVYGVYVFLVSPVDLWQKLATGAVVIGILALLASVIWERYREWLTDPYRDIQR
jgi:anti-sigma factor RsiW